MTQDQAITELKKFKDLLDVNAITQEEYDAIKAQLLPALRKGLEHPQNESIKKDNLEEKEPATKDAMGTKTKSAAKVGKSTSAKTRNIVLLLIFLVFNVMVVGVTLVIDSNSQKKPIVKSRPVSVVTPQYVPADIPATDQEIASAWYQWLKLYDEMEKFKKKSDFHKYGISSAGPYYGWTKRVESLEQTKGAKEMGAVYDVNCYDLKQVAIQYADNKGRDNNYTRYIAGIVKNNR